MNIIQSPKDFFAGIAFIVVALIFGFGIVDLRIGSAFQMGPGYFPLILTILLAGLGFVLAISGLRVRGEPVGKISWRGILLIVLPVLFFGIALRGLGLLLALAITIFAASAASRQWNASVSAINTVALVTFSYIVFIWLLGLPIPLIGSWIGG